MRIIRHLVLATCLATTACGTDTPGDAVVGRRMREPDATRVAPGSIAGGKADAQTMRVRRVAGTWRASGSSGNVEATFGNDGSLSVQVDRDGGIVDAASGSWTIEDGILSGTMDGGGVALSRYARWRAAFGNDTTINLSGSGGAILTLRR